MTFYQPEDLREALEILGTKGDEAMVYAGGTDVINRLKNRLDSSPKTLVDVSRIGSLRSIGMKDGRLEIGALCSLSTVLDSPAAKSYPILLESLEQISSPELRNQSTIGGDILQESWCPYYRGNYSCYRNGGNVCYGETGDNAVYQSVMGAKKSYAVYPGDAAVALVALDAAVEIEGPDGSRTVTLEELLPGEVEVGKRFRFHLVGSDEILTKVVVPSPPAASETGHYYQKVRYREVWDFALASLALTLKFDGMSIGDARVVFGGIATRPWRDGAVEAFLRGKRASEALPEEATRKALAGPKPLKHNAYKVDMATGLLYSGLRSIIRKRMQGSH